MTSVSPRTTGYALWALPGTPTDEDQLQMLIDRIADEFQLVRFPIHLTVVGLPDHAPAKEDVLVEYTKHIASRSSSFEIEITGIGQRKKFFQNTFLGVVPSDELIKLHNRTLLTLSQHQESLFMPHLSLAYGNLSQDDKYEALQMIQQTLSFPYCTSLTRLSLIATEGSPDRWRTVVTYNLKI